MIHSKIDLIKRPIVLVILDGWGYSLDYKYNAIYHAQPKMWNYLWDNYPHTLLSASGLAVGLPEGQIGNSEVGHMHIGAGRPVLQDLVRIDGSIKDGSFKYNTVLLEALKNLESNGSNLHLVSLLSTGGVHSHEDHLLAFLDILAEKGIRNSYCHAILDGRDTPPRSALSSLNKLEHALKQYNMAPISSIVGRYYAMDRDNRWERTLEAYKLLTQAEAKFQAEDSISALTSAYSRNENDEFVSPTIINNKNSSFVPINKNDIVVFMNFRSDRMRQLLSAFNNPVKFFPQLAKAKSINKLYSLTQYDENLPVKVFFPPINLSNTLGQYLSNNGLSQFRIAETEKYAHVTFFFNGGMEKLLALEDRKLISSPKVSSYDLAPEMSAYPLTEELVAAILSNKYDFIVCNYANPDMVGHTGNFEATIASIKVVDDCISQVYSAVGKVNGRLIITADHGNAEKMYDESTGQRHTAHTTDKVPFIYCANDANVDTNSGSLCDIAPTILYLMKLNIPKEMTGRILLRYTS